MRGVHRNGIVAALTLLVVLLAPFALAANDPGHDSLYVLRIGDTNITGSINLTGNVTASFVRFTSKAFGDYLDLVANGTVLAAPSTPRIMGATNSLYIDSTGNLYLNTKGGTTGIVQVGDTATNGVTLNVSGVIRQQNVLVCLSNGSNCISGTNGGNVTTVTAGAGLTNSGTATDPILNVGAGDGISVAADSVAVDATVCRSDGSNCPASSTNVSSSTTSTDNAVARWHGTGGTTIQNSAVTIDDTGNIFFGGGFGFVAVTASAIRLTDGASGNAGIQFDRAGGATEGITTTTSGKYGWGSDLNGADTTLRRVGAGHVGVYDSGSNYGNLTVARIGIGTTALPAALNVNGTVNVTAGNITTQTGNGICFNAACTSRIYYNGTATIIEGT